MLHPRATPGVGARQWAPGRALVRYFFKVSGLQRVAQLVHPGLANSSGYPERVWHVMFLKVTRLQRIALLIHSGLVESIPIPHKSYSTSLMLSVTCGRPAVKTPFLTQALKAGRALATFEAIRSLLARPLCSLDLVSGLYRLPGLRQVPCP